MRNILLLYERKMPTVVLTEKALTRMFEGNFTVSTRHVLGIGSDDINKADIVILIRPDNLYSSKVAKCARRSGATVITFCDDDLLNISKADLPQIPWRKRALLGTIAESDIMLSPSRFILEKYTNLTHGKRSAILDTPVFEEDFADIPEKKNDVVKIVYAASPNHVVLFNKYVKEAYQKIACEYGSKIETTFIGLRPDVDAIKEKTKIIFKASMPLDEYRAYMAQGHFDIGLAPLNSDEFSKCKYFNKYFEYSMSGVMGLYSNTEPNTYVVTDGENGLLVDDDKWYEAIKTAIDNADLRRKCIVNARKHVRENFSRDRIVNNLRDTIPELNSESKNRTLCSSFTKWKIPYYFYRLLDYVYLVGYYLSHGGIRKLADKIVVHFRENGTAK